MSLLKNSFGVSIGFIPQIAEKNFANRFVGSTLERKPINNPAQFVEDPIDKMLKSTLRLNKKVDNEYKERFMSPRTKAKIRKKVIALSRLHEKLSFVTLTFLNKVSDREALKILGAFLDNASKRFKDFQYIWVVEKQTKNKIYENNIHFHLITNKFWKIDRWWNYWIEVQNKYGVNARDQKFKPSSAFDVKAIRSTNIKAIGNYITKYITKNQCGFNGMLWNCSRKISQLYTDFYSDMEFIQKLQQLQQKGILKGHIQVFQQEHCTVYLVPLNHITTHLYNCIDELNRAVWELNKSNN